MRNSKRLIELVRSNPCLYDKQHLDYLNGGIKRQLWQRISQEMNIPTAKCKTRWNNMRDSYRKSMLKKTKQYKYSKQMSFLNPYLRKDFISAIQKVEDDNECKANSEDGDWDKSSTIQSKDVNGFDDTEDISGRYAYPEFQDTTESPMDFKETHMTPYVCPDHPVDAFLSGIAPTLKSLSAYDLSMAKMEIFQIIHKYELKSIQDQEIQSQCAIKVHEVLTQKSEIN